MKGILVNMIQVSNFNKAFVELKEIMEYFDNEIKNKIPNDLKKSIEKVSKNEYQFIYDKQLPLYEQNILPETKALLSILYSDYLCSQEEKEKWDEYDKVEQQLAIERLEKQKQEKYNPNDLFKRKSNDFETLTPEESKEKLEIVEYKKQKWYQKLIENIQKILKKIAIFGKRI